MEVTFTQNSSVPLAAARPEAQATAPARNNGPANTRDTHGHVASVIVQQEFPPNTRLHLDEESNRIVAQVLDENNEVVRQLPPQELLDITACFNRLEGILFDEQR